MLNKVTLIGNLGHDPELRNTQGGNPVTTIRLATTARRKVGDEWTDATEWHNVVIWGKTAENVHKFAKKGKQLYIEGRLQTRKWQDKDGQDRYSTEVVAEVVQFLGGRSGEEDAHSPANSGPSGGARPEPRAQAAPRPPARPAGTQAPAAGQQWDDGEIPF